MSTNYSKVDILSISFNLSASLGWKTLFFIDSILSFGMFLASLTVLIKLLDTISSHFVVISFSFYVLSTNWFHNSVDSFFDP